jgi:hypothetical protein
VEKDWTITQAIILRIYPLHVSSFGLDFLKAQAHYWRIWQKKSKRRYGRSQNQFILPLASGRGSGA